MKDFTHAKLLYKLKTKIIQQRKHDKLICNETRFIIDKGCPYSQLFTVVFVLPLLLCSVACFLFTLQSLSKATEISEKSCGKDTPFPKHPGIEQCCTFQGQERKLCLASLRYSADELPSLLEPTNEEICTEFTKDEKDYAVR